MLNLSSLINFLSYMHWIFVNIFYPKFFLPVLYLILSNINIQYPILIKIYNALHLHDFFFKVTAKNMVKRQDI